MATPLTDSINALTQYANEITGASDTNLSDAVYTLAQGYGGGSSSWLPASAELVASADETINLSSDTSWDSITPSTSTQQEILSSGSTRGACSYTLTADETANKGIIAVAHYGIEYAYTSTPESAYPINQESIITGMYCMIDLSVADDYGFRTWFESVRQHYVNASGSSTLGDNAYYGIIPTTQLFTISSSSSTTPTVGFTRRAITTRCNTDRFSTDSAALIDSANTNIVYKYRIYLVDKTDHPLYACFDANNGIIS